jgi:hypothetical protein
VLIQFISRSLIRVNRLGWLERIKLLRLLELTPPHLPLGLPGQDA